jgi:hypothetical protein
MSIDLSLVTDLVLKLGLGAIVWETILKPLTTNGINFFYAGKLENKKSRYARDLEYLKTDLSKDLQMSVEEIKLNNAKQIEGYKRSVDSDFRKQEALVDTKLKAQLNASGTFFNQELSIYTEVIETLYRCRNLSRGCLLGSTRTRVTISDYFQYVHHLTEKLYTYRLFFPHEIFRSLHSFKCEVQEYSILLNEVTRSLAVEDAPVNPIVSQMAVNQMEAKYLKINSLFELLDREIKDLIKEKTSFN